MALGNLSKEEPVQPEEILAQAKSVDDILAQAMSDPEVTKQFLLHLMKDRDAARNAPAEQYYVGSDQRTRVDPRDLPPGSTYFHHDFRTPGFKVASNEEAWYAEFGERIYIREDEESVPFIAINNLRWELPMNEEVRMPKNVFDALRWTNTARREAQNGKALRRIKPDITVGFGAVNATYGEAESA